MTILILSTKVDIATDAVIVELDKLGSDVIRLNTEDYPYRSALSTHQTDTFHDISLRGHSTFRSCWYRRIRRSSKPVQMEAGIHDFCVREARAHVESLAINFRGPIMSRPEAIWVAEHKLVQLQRAALIGLSIPETVISNDPAVVTDAFRRFAGQMICKPLTTGHIETDSGPVSIYTSQVLESHLENVSDSSYAPSIYQPLIRKKCDVRVTIVDRKVFVAEIESQVDPDGDVDWRRGDVAGMLHREAMLPPNVEKRLLGLMKALDLQFGAIDLIRTPNDEYIFLEVNPNGQWLWIEDQLGLAISRAIAEWLSNV